LGIQTKAPKPASVLLALETHLHLTMATPANDRRNREPLDYDECSSAWPRSDALTWSAVRSSCARPCVRDSCLEYSS